MVALARGLACATLSAASAFASGDAAAPPAAALEAHPQLRAAGAGRFTWFGFKAYDARLWAVPGFSQSGFENSGFALELAYLRDFKSADIARRSIEEMRRAGPLSEEEAARWQAALRRVLPDVKEGDRVVGIHRPGQGASFLVNGRAVGEIGDPRFARLFFGIWLAPSTSEPGLRKALLAGAPP